LIFILCDIVWLKSLLDGRCCFIINSYAPKLTARFKVKDRVGIGSGLGLWLALALALTMIIRVRVN